MYIRPDSLEIIFSQPLNPGHTIQFEGIKLEYTDNIQLFDDERWGLFTEGVDGNIAFTYKLAEIGIRPEKIISDSSQLTLFTPTILTEPEVTASLDTVRISFTTPSNISALDAQSFQINFGNDTLQDVILNVLGQTPDTVYSKESDYTFHVDHVELFLDNYGELFELGLAKINAWLQSSGQNPDNDLTIIGNRNTLYNTEDISFDNDYKILDFGYEYDFNILDDPLLTIHALENSLITLGEEFEGDCNFRIVNESFVHDTLITIGDNHSVQFSDILGDHQLGSGVFFLVVNKISSNARSDTDNTLPLIKQFVIDNDAPIILSDKSYTGISKDGYGHKYHFSDQIIFSFQDNVLIDENEILFISDPIQGPVSATNYSNMTDSLDVFLTLRWGEEDYMNSDSFSQMIKPVQLGLETINYSGILDSIYTSLIDSVDISSIKDLGVQNLRTKLEISITDQAGNESLDTLFISFLFDLGKILSASAFNFPNPFSNVEAEGTQIRYLLNKEASSGKLIIFNAGGNVVYFEVISQPNLMIGTHYIKWNGRNSYGYRLASGVYFAFLEFNDTINEKIKIVILNK